MKYGNPPEDFGVVDLDWVEFMRWLYCPIRIGQMVSFPPNLVFLNQMVAVCEREEARRDNDWEHVYVSAQRGFATPGNPLNRPGWHADGFGSPDINYIWTDGHPTLFAEQEFIDISDDHIRSAEQFEEQVLEDAIVTYPNNTLLRLDPSVIHAAPEIPPPGGMRSFVKISFSNDRYNLEGNSHNHGLGYNWKMYSREELRNDPAFAGGDAGPQT